MEDLRTIVVRAIRAAGADAVGVGPAHPFADARRALEDRRARGLHGGMQFTYRNPARSTDPRATVEGARSIVVAARSYRGAQPPPPGRPSGAVARYAREDAYGPLRLALEAGVVPLEGRGHRARVLVDDNALVDRAAAVRAGIGWYGKNTNVLVPGAGSWFVLGSLVTDADLRPFDEQVDDGCGPCTACIPACPTGAIVAPGVLDARRCLAWLLEAPGDFPRELRESLGGRIYGCDDCQEACPPNRLADRRSRPPTHGVDDSWIDLVWLVTADDDELMGRVGRWYIPGRDPAHVRRNALVALGNVGRGDDPRTAGAIAAALDHPNPMIRRHAVWAAVRLGLTPRAAAAARADPDDSVRAEFLAAGPGPPH